MIAVTECLSEQFKGGKPYFGSQFQMSAAVPSWLRRRGSCSPVWSYLLFRAIPVGM